MNHPSPTHRPSRLRILAGVSTLAAVVLLGAPAASAADTSTSTESLTATQKGDPDGTGSIVLTLNSSTGQVCSTLTTSNIVTPAAAHIHSGVAGSTGPIVVTLSTTTGCSANDPALISSIVADPAAFYVNVHNADYPNGAIRGQVAPTDASMMSTTSLDGLGFGDPDGTGTATFTFYDNGDVCYDLAVTNIGTPTAAHIHTGASGVQGSVLIGLPIADTGLNGCTSSTTANVDAILADPAGFYVNVHNAEYPNGAIRSQLAAVTASTTTEYAIVLAPSGDIDGSGTAMLDIDPDTGRVCYQLTIADTGAVTVAHIHDGDLGQDGPIVVDFDVPTNGLSSCVSVDAAVTTAIVAAPGAFYVNVHTAEYPKGAVRAQVNGAVPSVTATTTTPNATTPATTVSPQIPATGTDNGAMTLVAVAMLGLGGTLVAATRRRDHGTV